MRFPLYFDLLLRPKVKSGKLKSLSQKINNDLWKVDDTTDAHRPWQNLYRSVSGEPLVTPYDESNPWWAVFTSVVEKTGVKLRKPEERFHLLQLLVYQETWKWSPIWAVLLEMAIFHHFWAACGPGKGNFDRNTSGITAMAPRESTRMLQWLDIPRLDKFEKVEIPIHGLSNSMEGRMNLKIRYLGPVFPLTLSIGGRRAPWSCLMRAIRAPSASPLGAQIPLCS